MAGEVVEVVEEESGNEGADADDEQDNEDDDEDNGENDNGTAQLDLIILASFSPYCPPPFYRATHRPACLLGPPYEY